MQMHSEVAPLKILFSGRPLKIIHNFGNKFFTRSVYSVFHSGFRAFMVVDKS